MTAAFNPGYLADGLAAASGETVRLEVRDGLKPALHHVEHHRAHLASAFFVAPFDDAAVISIDGFGDFASTLLAEGHVLPGVRRRLRHGCRRAARAVAVASGSGSGRGSLPASGHGVPEFYIEPIAIPVGAGMCRLGPDGDIGLGRAGSLRAHAATAAA